MYRRRMLALLGTATAVAGCPRRNGDPSTPSPTDGEVADSTEETPADADTATSTATPSPDTLALGDAYRTASGETLRASEVHLARSVFDLVYPDAVSPLAPTDTQFVFLTIGLADTNALVPNPESLRLLVDDEAITGGSHVADRGIDSRLAIPNEFVHLTPELAAEQGEDRATVGFEVPIDVDPTRVAIEWRGDDERARWEWGEALVDELASPPTFDVTGIDHPETFVCGETFEVSVAVSNAGGRAEAFRAIFPAIAPIAEAQTVGITEPVPADGTAAWTGSLEFPPPLSGEECTEDVEAATFELDWGINTRRMTLSRAT